MLHDLTAHKTLVNKEYFNRTGYLPREAWAVLEDLVEEARLLNLERRLQHLEGIWNSSPSIGGWGQTKLVEAMNGESKPDGPAPAAFLGVPMPMMPQQPQQAVVEPKRRLTLRERVLGR